MEIIDSQSELVAKAHIRFDEDYFLLTYDQWLKYRSRFRKYEIGLSLGLIAFGIVMAILFSEFWLLGFSFAACGLFEFCCAATHRRRYVKEVMKHIRDDKTVDLEFYLKTFKSSSKNAVSTSRYSMFVKLVEGSEGVFLIPETGVSIFVPRLAIEPEQAYRELVELVSAEIEAANAPAK